MRAYNTLRSIALSILPLFIMTSCGNVEKSESLPITTHIITFDSRGGSEVAPIEVEHGGKITRPQNPTRDGYKFGNWNKEDNRAWSFDDDVVIDDMTLYASWAAELFKLRINCDTTRGTTTISYSKTSYVDGVYTGDQILVVASPKDDYVFDGWYDNSIKVSNSAIYIFNMPPRDYTLEARFYTYEEAKNISKGITPYIDSDSNTISYGLYPQARVSDKMLVESLETLTEVESNGWYLYNGEYYAKDIAKPTRTATYYFIDGTKIEEGKTYWYKCEPIIWKILNVKDDSYLLLSESVLDAQIFAEYRDGKDYAGRYCNNYQYSNIRSWLLNDFYNTAFIFDNSIIQTTFVDNSVTTTGSNISEYICNDTNDKVFLLSYKDYLNPEYGFSEDRSCEDEMRQSKPSEWAVARGVLQRYLPSGATYWTRTPAEDAASARYIDRTGEMRGSAPVMDYFGVRPAITVKLS